MFGEDCLVVGRKEKEEIGIDANLIPEITKKYCLYVQRRYGGQYWKEPKKQVLAWKRGTSSWNRRKVPLKQIILGIKKGEGVDVLHKNGNPLDCRKENLEVVSSQIGKKRKKKKKLIKRY